MTNSELNDFLEKYGKMFRPNPWHGIKTWDNEDKKVLNAYIEITPNDRVKYEVHKESGYLMVDRPQKFSNIIPQLYGLIPRTYSDSKSASFAEAETERTGIVGDHDPIDICVLAEKNIVQGDILVNCIPVGGFRMLDGGEIDDKIIAVLKDDAMFGHITDIDQVPAAVLAELKHYFLTYKEIPVKDGEAKVEITETYNAETAMKVINLGVEDYNEKFVK
ncbi:inorganic pyrophosphatase [Halobacteriovorax sp. RT-1-4]|uniref:inorganic pyrophosphatase n=1 Tax=unclassified Halobacteriovorax TaxID=2639665 RepID=UPI00399BC26D